MKITEQQIRETARLARLDLDDAEVARLGREMDAILGYVDKLNRLATDGVEPTSHAVPMENAFRRDEPTASLGVEKALRNAPDRVDDFYRVPKVIE